MDSKKTAVEWLSYMYTLQGAIYVDDLNKAIEMEKEQIGDAWENGKKSTQCKTPMCERKTGIGYYNKTFKQEQ